jgi:hypothetical protein
MGLSKLQHGLGVVRLDVAVGVSRVILDAEMLLDAVQKYCVEDQEWASYQAYASTGADTLLLLYEDLVATPDVVLGGIQPIFSHQLRAWLEVQRRAVAAACGMRPRHWLRSEIWSEVGHACVW